MKVKEIIEKLSKMGQDREVIIRFGLDKNDDIGYILVPFAIDQIFEDEVAIYAEYTATKEDCDFIGQVDLKEAYLKQAYKQNENIIEGLTIDNLNKILDDRLICIQGGRGLYAKLKGLDKEYLIREYLLMYKMNKAELEKKDKIIDEMAIFIANLDTDENICKHQVAEFCEGTDGVSLDICVKCVKKYIEKKVEEKND